MANRTLTSPKISLTFQANNQNTLNDATLATSPIAATYAPALVAGIQVLGVNRAWQWKSKALASGAYQIIDLFDFENLDVGAGGQRDGVGQLLIMEEVVAILVINENLATDDAAKLEVKPASTDGWTPIGVHTVALGGAISGGGVIFKVSPSLSGFAITDGSNHRLRVEANGGSVTYSVYVLGRHDVDESSSSSSSSVSSSSSSSSSSVSSSSSSSVSSVSSSSSSISTSSSSSSGSSSSSSVSSSSNSSLSSRSESSSVSSSSSSSVSSSSVSSSSSSSVSSSSQS